MGNQALLDVYVYRMLLAGVGVGNHLLNDWRVLFTHHVYQGLKSERYLVPKPKSKIWILNLYWWFSAAEKQANVKVHFEHKLVNAQLDAGLVTFKR